MYVPCIKPEKKLQHFTIIIKKIENYFVLPLVQFHLFTLVNVSIMWSEEHYYTNNLHNYKDELLYQQSCSK